MLFSPESYRLSALNFFALHPDQRHGRIYPSPAAQWTIRFEISNQWFPADLRLLHLKPLISLFQSPFSGKKQRAVVIGLAEKCMACCVDKVLGTNEIVIKKLGHPLKRVKNITGVTILGDGQVVMVLNVADLMSTAWISMPAYAPLASEPKKPIQRRILVVDDSITTRTLEKNILESAGYQVLVAFDGQEAWELLQKEPVDIIVSDIAMPNMDGCALTKKVKNDDRFKEFQVILVPSLESKKDKIRGMNVGADAYIKKSSFDQTRLLETIEGLIV